MPETWPCNLPGPLVNSNAYQPAGRTERNDLTSGPLAFALDDDEGPVLFDVTFRMTAIETQVFRHFYRRITQSGAKSFTIPIPVDYVPGRTHICYFDSAPRYTQSGKLWTVSCTLLAIAPLTFDMTAIELTASQPVLDSPDVTLTFNLTAQELAASQPVLDSPGVTLTFNLTAQELTASQPILDSPTIDNRLVVIELTAGQPVLDSPVLMQNHSLQAVQLDAGQPVLDDGPLSTNYELTANELTAGQPVLDSPTPTEVVTVGMTAQELTAGQPVLGSPTLTETEPSDSGYFFRLVTQMLGN